MTNIGLTRPPIHLPQTDQNNNVDGDDDDNDDGDDAGGDNGDDNDDAADGDYGVVVMTMVVMEDCSSKQLW